MATRGRPEVGDYWLQSTLGVGSTGKVKLAEHKETGKKVAMKIISKSTVEEQPDLAVKIRREISLMKLFDNPHLLRLVDVYESAQHLYIILEYAEHGELFDYMQERSLTIPEGMHFFRQIIYGLEFLHKHGICHRDLKPENILLDEHDTIKIADFGFARWMKVNTVDTACGSPHYASPEVIMGDRYDGMKSDIWSAGVILYTMLSGKLPFNDGSIRQLLLKVKSGEYRMPDFPPEIQDLISRMLQVDPQKRITLSEIKAHDAFRWDLPKFYTFPSPLPLPVVLEPIDPATLEPETMDVLRQLGFDENELEDELRSNEQNMAKAFVYMLTKTVSFDSLPWNFEESGTQGIQDSIVDHELVLGSNGMFGGLGSASIDNTSPFYRKRASHELSLNSMEECSIIERSLLSEEAPTYACNSTREIEVLVGLEPLMTALQDFLTREHFAWFYPDETKLMARRSDEAMDVLLQTEVDITKQLKLKISLPKGNQDEFEDLVARIETEVEGIVP